MRIAILDDDRTALQLVEQALTGGHDDAWTRTLKISYFTSGRELLERLREERFDALVLDRQLPDINGDEILKWVRAHLPADVVVVMVTSLGGLSESLTLLESGADDYLTKPFSGAELYARLKRLLARTASGREVVEAVRSESGGFELLGFSFDRAKLSIRWRDEVTVCTEREFELAAFFFRHAGRPLSREELYETIYRRRAVNSSRALDTLVHRTRAKLQLDERRNVVVQPIYGFGYRLDILSEGLS